MLNINKDLVFKQKLTLSAPADGSFFLFLQPVFESINMKNIFQFLAFSLFIFISACNSNDSLRSFEADKQLSTEQQLAFKTQIIRFVGKLHKKATHESKFDPFFSEYYHELAKKHTLLYYVPNAPDGFTYFSIKRIAPSMKLKEVAIAGRVKFNSQNEITYYEEIYRTWKMEPKELNTKNNILFSKLLKGEDLSPYYNHMSGDEEWIEFPDKDIQFDVESRRWLRDGEFTNLEDIFDLKK